MKKNRINSHTKAALALAVCALSVNTYAIDMGKIIVYSHLSEPLNASVLLSDNHTDRQESDFDVQISAPSVYAMAGIKRPEWADSAELSIKKIDSNRYELKIKTNAAVDSPASSLLIDIKMKGDDSPISREYAIILDPSDDPKPLNTAHAPASSPSLKDRHTATALSTDHPYSVSDGQIVVKSGQILYAIAQSKKPSDISVERMMIGLLRSNPQAFSGSNINRLKAGAILRMPERPELEAIKQAEAALLVNQQSEQYSHLRTQAASNVAAVDSKSSGQTVQGKIGQVAPTPDAEKDQLKLGKATQKAHSHDADKTEGIAKQKEIDEAKSRIKDLEKMRDDLQKLLTIKDQQLAEAQKNDKAKPEKNLKPDIKSEDKPDIKNKEESKDIKPEIPADSKANDASKKISSDHKAKEDSKSDEGSDLKDSQPEPKSDVAASSSAQTPPPIESQKKPTPKPLPAPTPEPVPEATLMDQVIQNGTEYGPYAGGGLLALFGGLFLLKKRKKTKISSTTITPEHSPLDAPSSELQQENAPNDFEEHINSADTYIAFDQPKKATLELEIALKLSPSNPEALIRLARIANKLGDRDELGRLAAILGDATFRSGPLWVEVDQMISKFAKADSEPTSNLTESSSTVDIDLSSLDLEQSLMNLNPSDPTVVQTSNDKTSSSKNMEAVSSSTKNDDHGMDMNFDLPAFDEPVKSEVSAPKEAPPAFDHLSFDLSLPDDKLNPSLESTSETFSMDAPELQPLDSDMDSELKTMLELAKAYMDMGDRDGSRELLVEIEQKGSPELAALAKEMIAKL